MKKIISKNKEWVTRMLLLTVLLTAAILQVQKGYSQNIQKDKPQTCGSYTINTAALKAAKDFESANASRLLSASFSIRVYFHIFNDDNGTNAGATAAQIQTEFNQLVSDYAANNICFINMGLNYINSSTLNTMNLNNSSLLQPYLVPNCINIFYHASIIGAGGSAYSIPSTFCSIARGNIGPSQTISHEVGHCFGLLHTFEPVKGYENINGSNSASAADQITDTPADPYAYNGAPCFTTSSCCYTGNCTDPNGQSNFTPPYSNMMAYWWAFGYTNLSITSGQYLRANSYLSTNSALQNCGSTSFLTVGPVTYISGYNMFSAINTLTTNGSVNLGGFTTTTLGGSLVLAEPGFYANALGGAQILIRPSACVAGAGKKALQASAESSSAIAVTQTNSNGLRCYPNPFSQRFTVEFDLSEEDKAVLKLYDINGKQLQVISNSFFTKGSHQIKAEVSALPPGIYIVVLQTSRIKKQQKIVKIN
ncbi:MAG: zinc-dependent metalloprotease [Panacibacter sp.]